MAGSGVVGRGKMGQGRDGLGEAQRARPAVKKEELWKRQFQER